MPPRRWKLNDCTSNAFYFDFNQHVQKLLDKETTKCLFQKWFPIFIIALTLAGVRHLRVDTLVCGVKKGCVLPTCGFLRNRCMRMFPIQLILTDSYITSTFRILSPYIYIYIYYWFHHWYLQKCMWTTTACQDHLSAAARLYWRYAWCIDHGICQIT